MDLARSIRDVSPVIFIDDEKLLEWTHDFEGCSVLEMSNDKTMRRNVRSYLISGLIFCCKYSAVVNHIVKSPMRKGACH